ncbi:MAG: conjugal transfer protein TraN [Limnohabitans sp.]|jgi:conjugal transfer mating pair stabilization protein TraN|uniref:conjugal transfer protein TraN n=1 Tax=Limnohabitans sp. TaxID=1907725 RepID=UPI00391A45E4
MKGSLSLLLCLFVGATAAQGLPIRPGTLYCNKGSDAHPTSYCVDATPCKTVADGTYCLAGTQNPPAGATVGTLSCWSLATDYTCMQYKDGCTTYTSDANCKEVGSASCTLDATGGPMLATNSKVGACQSMTRTFACADPRKDTPGYTVTTSCNTTGVQDGLTWQTATQSAAGDFIQAATGQEIARQLALYGQKESDGIKGLFAGRAYGCRDGYFGLKNCCKSRGGGAVTNQTWASKLGMTVAMGGFKMGAGYAAAKGSSLVYDSVLSNAPEFMQPGLISFLRGAENNSWQSAGFGAFGLGTTAQAAAGTFASASSSVAVGTVGNSTLYFNPYALAIAVGIQVVMEALSCTQDEMDLASARTENLCADVGSYCSKHMRVLGVTVACLETTQSFCCFNSLLAKAISDGAQTQLALGRGSAQSPNCAGLTPQQLSSIDFTTPQMQQSMEPFKAQIMNGFEGRAAPALANGSVQADMAQRTSANSSALCLQRKKLDPTTVCN